MEKKKLLQELTKVFEIYFMPTLKSGVARRWRQFQWKTRHCSVTFKIWGKPEIANTAMFARNGGRGCNLEKVPLLLAIGNNTVDFFLFTSFPTGEFLWSKAHQSSAPDSGAYPTHPSSTIFEIRTPTRALDGRIDREQHTGHQTSFRCCPRRSWGVRYNLMV